MTTKVCKYCGATFRPVPRHRKYCRGHCYDADRAAKNAENCRARYEKNRATYNADAKAYYAKHRDRIRGEMRERARQTRQLFPWKHIFAGAKNRAKVAGVDFDLTDDWAAARWTGKCEISGIEFTLGLKPSDMRMFSASVDRIDPAKGYTQDNCRFILFAVNCMKQDGTDEDVFAIARAITQNAPPVTPVMIAFDSGFVEITL